MTTKLGRHEGCEIAGQAIAIRNVGDGLSKAIAVDPVKLPLDSTVYVVVEAAVVGHTYKSIDGTRQVIEHVTLKGGAATLVDQEVVAPLLAAQAERIEAAALAAEEEAGVQRVPFGDDEDEG